MIFRAEQQAPLGSVKPSLFAKLATLLIVASLLFQILPPLTAVAAVANRALLLTAGGSEPSYGAMRQQLVRLGVPFTAVDAIPNPVTPELLQADENDGNFSMIILVTGNLAYEQAPGVWESALSAEEWETLWDYARHFSVRTIAYYAFPTSDYGLLWTGNVTTDTTGLLTFAGRTIFGDVKSTAQIPFTAYTYLATALPGFTPWITLTSGEPVVGLYKPGDGREILVSTADQSIYEVSSALLTPSMIKWVSKGGYTTWNVYFTMHVDDILIGNEHWPTFDHEIRMTAEDVYTVVNWQEVQDIKLDMTFNGEGFEEGESLSEAFDEEALEFRWVNHTWSHPNLDGATYQEAYNEFKQNITLSSSQGLVPFDRASAVTGEHSGITNPNVLAAAKALGIKYLATDASREPSPYYTANGILLIPRHPSNIFTDVVTREEEVARYNGIYGTNRTYEEIIDLESDIVLRHMLSGDPRPHFAHQINLAGDRILLDLINASLAKFRSLSKKSLKQLTFSGIGKVLAPQALPAAP